MEPMSPPEVSASRDRQPVAISTAILFRQTWGRLLFWTAAAMICVFGILVAHNSTTLQYAIILKALRFGMRVTIVFFVTFAVATLVAALLPPLRRLLPFAWRIWLWGTLGFISGFLLPDGVLVAGLMIIAITTGTNPFDSVGSSAMALYFLPPVGAVMGGLLGIAFGHSSARHSICSRSSTSSVTAAHEV